MFEIGLDKLLLVGLFVGLILGPERMLAWMREVRSFVQRAKESIRAGKAGVVNELDAQVPEWRDYDPRRIDPRRAVRDALELEDLDPRREIREALDLDSDGKR